MSDKICNVLFLCTGNSARSIMAECVLNRLGLGKFKAYSAGSRPKGEVHPMALHVLREFNHQIEGLRSKGWEELAGPDQPELDVVITVCDNAANEACPIWPGQPMTVHWGLDDPAAFVGSEPEQLAKFREVYAQLDRRIRDLVNLPIASLDKPSLQARLNQINGSTPKVS